VVFLNLRYADGKMANIQISWLDPYKERKLTIVGSKKMVMFDDMQASEKLKIYDKGVNKEPGYESYGDSLSLRFGEIRIPKIDMTEPLKLECQHFVECVRDRKQPFTDGREGVKVVKILEKAQESLKQNGIPVKVNL
jgi:predicted dehydrogenase